MRNDRPDDSHLDNTTVLLRELVDLFFEDCPNMMTAIRAAIDQNNAEGLRTAAHLLRASVGNFGASAAYCAAEKLEAMARAGDLTDAEEAYHTLDKALRQLQPVLAALALKPSN